MNRTKKQSGFSLFEMIIYLAITALILVIFTGFVADVLRSSKKVLVTKEVNQNARLVLTQISQAIKTAQSIDSVGPTQLDLTDKAGNAIKFYYDTVNKDVKYSLGSIDLAINNNKVAIDNLSFVSSGNNLVEISLTTRQKNNNPRPEGAYQLDLDVIIGNRLNIY